MTLYKQQYRTETTRLRGWDYATAGYYFVTICTKHRQHFFGNIVNEAVCLPPIGEIAADEWQRAAHVRHNVSLDEWIIMPNHLHGIIVIHAPDNDTNDVETSRWGVSDEDDDGKESMQTPRQGVSTADKSRLHTGSLGAIIGQFKSVATKRIWAAGHRSFAWQTRFYDTIIRDIGHCKICANIFRTTHIAGMWIKTMLERRSCNARYTAYSLI